MTNALKCDVYLWCKKVASLILIKNKISLRYEKDCSYAISPLSFPSTTSQYTFTSSKHNGLEGVFIDSLPDSSGMEILNKYFEDNYPDFTPNTIDKLLFIGDVSLGALEYRPAYANIEDESIGIKLQELRTHRKELLRTKDYNSVRNLVSLYKSFSPLAGARSKLLLNYHPRKESFSIGKASIDEIAIILKLDETQSSIKSIDTKVEWIYSQVAKKAGLNMLETYLFKDADGFSHFGAQRFDVDEYGERFHTISLSGLLNVDKAQRVDLKEFLEIGKSILFLPKEDLEEIFRRVVFNYVYNNNDDHLKNHEFLMSKDGTWRLSPLFDVTFNSKIGSRYMRTKINSKNSDKATLDDFAVIAKEYKIKNYEAIITEVQDAKELLVQLINSMISDEYYDVDRENILNINLLKVVFLLQKVKNRL